MKSEVFQIIHDFGTGPVLWADEFAADFALAVDDVGFRGTGRAEGQIALLQLVVDGEEVDVIVGEELVIGGRIIIEVHTENDDLRHLLLESVERGQLFKTRRAPGCPKIEDHGFATVIAEVDGF